MDSISLLQAQRRLSVVWLIGALLQFLLLLLQGLSGFWKDTTGLPKVDHTVDAMQWLIANIAPTLTLILGVLVASETQAPVQREFKRQRRSQFFFRLTVGVCVFYLVTVMIFPLAASARVGAGERFQLLRYAGFVLPFLQGLVAVTLGAFFYKVPDASDTSAHDAPVAEGALQPVAKPLPVATKNE